MQQPSRHDSCIVPSRDLGLEAESLDGALEGEARAAARSLAAIALSRKKTLGTAGKTLCLIAGGETTVKVRGKGAAGRIQKLALAFGLDVAGNPGITCLRAGTDGTDGQTDATGAIVDGNTTPLAFSTGLNPLVHLENVDSCGFYEGLSRAAAGAAYHLKTGPTGTNVLDLIMIALSPSGEGRGND